MKRLLLLISLFFSPSGPLLSEPSKEEMITCLASGKSIQTCSGSTDEARLLSCLRRPGSTVEGCRMSLGYEAKKEELASLRSIVSEGEEKMTNEIREITGVIINGECTQYERNGSSSPIRIHGEIITTGILTLSPRKEVRSLTFIWEEAIVSCKEGGADFALRSRA